jgi:CO/xanthine dehydrogenase FAD-binding subunit
MIVEYHRPKKITDALKLIENIEGNVVLMGGGTAIDRFSTNPMVVVDLQDVDLGKIKQNGKFLEIGATATLQELHDYPDLSKPLKQVIMREATRNLRQVATVAGTLISSDGRSPLTTAMLALDASLTVIPGDETISLGNLLPLRDQTDETKLVTKITIPNNANLAYEDVSRTPADLPILSACVAAWPGGRHRIVLGGFGAFPALASDGPERGGEESAARDAVSQSGDEWASVEYRMEIAPILVSRCFRELDL